MNYWLIKSEPEEFGIDDLKRVSVEPWTGVRNYQARNTMRDLMRVGDQVLFYHSSITPPGVVGLAEVASKPYPDPTQFDAKSDYYDPKSSRNNPRWILVDMKYLEHFPRMVTLDELRNHPDLQDMKVIKPGMRLSVQPVGATEFATVCKLARS